MAGSPAIRVSGSMFVWVLASCMGIAWGQQTGEIHGVVLDVSRAPITGAGITAARDGAVAGTAVSGEHGEFTLSLEPGSYTVTAEARGFQKETQVVEVKSSGSETREFLMPVAAIRETVTVEESPDYLTPAISSGTKTLTPLLDTPQSITVVTREQIQDQMMMSIADVVRYVPGITAHQGENNRDQLVIRGNSSSADFFVNGVRDDVQYYRDLYNLERVEALKGPNAMIFGRGGGGGVINRVTKEAGFAPLREVTLQGGSFGNKRFTGDFDQPLGNRAAFRMNAMYENSDSFRRFVGLERYGVSPSLTINAGRETRVMLGYEHFRDMRTADRGITSFQGRPAAVPISTFYGNPDESHVNANVNLGSALVDHQAGRLNIRNRTLFGSYGRGYQNFVPRDATADMTQVSLSAYNNATNRLNVFNQTDVSYIAHTGGVRHTLLWGAELGRQLTDNFRNTGYFNNSATSILVPFNNPLLYAPTTFRQSATDADNHLKVNLGATYVQDQIEVSRYLQFITGLRFDYFDLRFHNNRNGSDLRRIDNLVSPRAGVVVKPAGQVSLYGSYSVSYLPSAGDQFASLTDITQQVKPEKFTNYEMGVKWDAARKLSLTTAVYRLNRTNTRSLDPNDPTRIVQTGSQRTNGVEIGVNGSLTRFWQVAGGYAYQDAFVTSATASAFAGAQVAQAPHNTFSLWNNLRLQRRWGAGLGILNRSDMFAAIDDRVILPAYTRVDAAVFFTLTENVRLQANVENVFDRRYYVNADSNTNISPGFPRAAGIGLTVRF